MSLVAYGSSSDEDSENEDETLQTKAEIPTTSKHQSTNGHISDEDDEFYPDEEPTRTVPPSRLTSLALPKPKNTTSQDPNSELDENLAPIFAKLPMPRGAQSAAVIVEEEDDEFLRKKELPDVETEKPLPPSQKNAIRVPVKISIPSMKEFSDVDAELAQSSKNKTQTSHNVGLKKSGLLAMLPKAKSEQNFAKKDIQTSSSNSTATTSNPRVAASFSLIPDTVKNRRPAQNTEGVDGVKAPSKSKKPGKKSTEQKILPLVDCSDSETSDNEAEDFFSLKDDEQLPEVNRNEISVMVAKKAARMAEATSNYLKASTLAETSSIADAEPDEHDEEELRKAQKRYHEKHLNDEALNALVGSSSKRRRKDKSHIEIVDISSSQVLPDREEWMRTALASSTSYQPTGVMVDEEPAAGTRRKHQITYLAHKAKSNEAELQAMWSANRQNRRATQSKYGF